MFYVTFHPQKTCFGRCGMNLKWIWRDCGRRSEVKIVIIERTGLKLLNPICRERKRKKRLIASWCNTRNVHLITKPLWRILQAIITYLKRVLTFRLIRFSGKSYSPVWSMHFARSKNFEITGLGIDITYRLIFWFLRFNVIYAYKYLSNA